MVVVVRAEDIAADIAIDLFEARGFGHGGKIMKQRGGNFQRIDAGAAGEIRRLLETCAE